MTESPQIPATLEAGQKAVMDALKAYTAKAALEGCFEKVDQATKITRLFEKVTSQNRGKSEWSHLATLLWQQSEAEQPQEGTNSIELEKKLSTSKRKTPKEHFFRNKTSLVKTARPKSGKEYRHLAPHAVFLSVIQAAAKIGTGLQPFNFDDLLDNLDLNEGKPYQVRIVVLALRRANIFKATHRGMYRCEPTIEENALEWFKELPAEETTPSKRRRRRKSRKGKG